MTKKNLTVIGAVVLLVIAVMALCGWRITPALSVQAPNPSNPWGKPITESGLLSWIPFHEYQQLSLKAMSRDEATKIYVQRFNQDHTYDWKVALNFYGKVVDEKNQPVSGANVSLMWNTIGVPGGTAASTASSDEKGLFSLTGQHGKVLEVCVQKKDYYTVDGGLGGLAFEYANPSDPNYYEPDANNPVIFHLRKKGEGTKLFRKTLDIPVSNKHPQYRVNLIQGFIKPDGNLIITSDTSKFLPGAQAFPWTVTLTMTEGGLVETTDQFPFQAPTSGYTSNVTMAMTDLDRKVWRGDMKKTYYFYLPSSNTYGQMTVDASSSLSLSLKYVYNPAPGQRYLEPASN